MSVIGSVVIVGLRMFELLSAVVLAMCVSALTMSKRRKHMLDRHRQRVEYWGFE